MMSSSPKVPEVAATDKVLGTSSLNTRLIVLDDEPGLLDSYRMLLSPPAPQVPLMSSRSRSSAAAQSGSAVKALTFQVTYASTGEEALAQIESAIGEGKPFVGGFFDVKLGPGIDGIETIKRAKDIDPKLLCVTVSAYQDRSIDEIAKIFGEDYADRWDFLTKPFSNLEILQKARHLVFNWEHRRREKEYLEKIKSQQALLIRQERLAAMGTLARGIGHEFGNILVRIIGKAEIARLKQDPAEMLEALKVIGASAERAGVIVRNLQGLVKMETKREPLQLNAPITDSVQLIAHELKKASVNLVEEYDETIPPLALNRIEMAQVFLNLFINATHAMEPNGGELRVKTSREADSVLIEVSDTGHGIPGEVLTHIFEPLFTTKGERGTGIGLSVTKKIIENHNGRIQVSSTPGRGTKFMIRLPFPKGV